MQFNPKETSKEIDFKRKIKSLQQSNARKYGPSKRSDSNLAGDLVLDDHIVKQPFRKDPGVVVTDRERGQDAEISMLNKSES